MSDYPEIARHFENDFAKAVQTECREDGLFRHIEYSAPKSMNRLIVITWPYNLLVAGSHGSYHFERYGQDTEDMFAWLRGIRIEPDRWASKLINGRDSVEEYDRNLMVAAINDRVAEAVRDKWAPEGLEADVREEILDSHLLDTKDTAQQLVNEYEFSVTYRAECSCGLSGSEGSYDSAAIWKHFTHKADGKRHTVKLRRLSGFDFDDFTEWNVDKVSYHFAYQCHAAAWAIAQYDAARSVKAVA
jgi:hypothetical protein